jgi:hypothetical protein
MPHPNRTFSLSPSLLSLAAGVLVLAPCAHADVRYTTQMTFGGMAPAAPPDGATPAGMTQPAMRTTTFVKDMHERVETVMNMGPIHTNQVILTLCDKHQTIKMDPDLKIYTAAPIGVATFAPPMRDRGRMPTGEAMPGDKPGVGHVTMTFTTQDLGTEKVADLDAQHYKISLRTQTTGCLGDGDRTMQFEEWVAPVKGGMSCPERYSASRMVPNTNGCQITYDMKGDWDKMRDMQSGMVVRQKIYNGDKVIATTDLRDYSLAALDDSLFTVPTDFKEVSETDFDKAEQDAMMKHMTGGTGQAATDPASSTAADAAGAAKDAANNAAGSAADTANGTATGTVDSAADKVKNKIPKIKLPHF